MASGARIHRPWNHLRMVRLIALPPRAGGWGQPPRLTYAWQQRLIRSTAPGPADRGHHGDGHDKWNRWTQLNDAGHTSMLDGHELAGGFSWRDDNTTKRNRRKRFLEKPEK